MRVYILLAILFGACANEPFEGTYGQYNYDKTNDVGNPSATSIHPIEILGIAPYDGALTGKNVVFAVSVAGNEDGFAGEVTVVIDGVTESDCQKRQRILETINGQEFRYIFECRPANIKAGWHTMVAYAVASNGFGQRSSNFLHQPEAPRFVRASLSQADGMYALEWELEEDLPVQLALRSNNVRIAIPSLKQGKVTVDNDLVVGKTVAIEAIDQHQNIEMLSLEVTP